MEREFVRLRERNAGTSKETFRNTYYKGDILYGWLISCSGGFYAMQVTHSYYWNQTKDQDNDQYDHHATNYEEEEWDDYHKPKREAVMRIRTFKAEECSVKVVEEDVMHWFGFRPEAEQTGKRRRRMSI